MGTNIDAYPVTVRGPFKQGSVRFARLFTSGEKLYLAEGLQRGKRVLKVTEYDKPEGEPQKVGGQTRWGQWSWSSCGCGNSWGSHTKEGLVSLAEPVQS